MDELKLRIEGPYPEAKEEKTDTFCLHFSIPVFVAAILLWLSVLYAGSDFSYEHPADEYGFRCGVNNNKFNTTHHDYRKLKYVTMNNSKLECVRKCSGNSFAYTCFPDSYHQILKAPSSFRLLSDMYTFRYRSIFIIIVGIALAYPIYYIFAKFSLIIFIIIFVITNLISFGEFALAISQKYTSMAFYAIIYSLSSFGIFLFLRKKLNIVKPIVTVALRLMKRNPSSLYVIPFMLVTGVVVLYICGKGALLSAGLGEGEILNGKLSIKRHFSLTLTTLLFLEFARWILEIIRTFCQIVVSHMVASEYFQRANIHLFKSAKVVFDRHLGTALLGGLISYALSDIAKLIKKLRDKVDTIENTFVRYLVQTIVSFFSILVDFTHDVSRLSPVFTAVKGIGFWDACKAALSIVAEPSVLSFEIVIRQIFFAARCLVALISSGLAWLLASKLGLFYPSIVILWTVLFVWLGTGAVEAAILTASETVLVCAKLEAEEGDGSYVPFELVSIFRDLGGTINSVA